MSRPRTMGAGLAGSMTKNVNVNMVQFGDKLQGLAPQATHFFIAGNGLGGWNNYRKRTNAPQRNFVFCMNQLGGVGAGKSQFKIRGLNKPDGTGNCRTGPYTLAECIAYLQMYWLKHMPGYTLCLVGEKEKIGTDLAVCCPSALLSSSKPPFIHLTDDRYDYTTENITPAMRDALNKAFITPMVHDTVMYVNSFCGWIKGAGCTPSWKPAGEDHWVLFSLGTHTLGLVPNDKIRVLRDCGGYGKWTWLGLRIFASTYACPCIETSGTDPNYDIYLTWPKSNYCAATCFADAPNSSGPPGCSPNCTATKGCVANNGVNGTPATCCSDMTCCGTCNWTVEKGCSYLNDCNSVDADGDTNSEYSGDSICQCAATVGAVTGGPVTGGPQGGVVA